MAQHSPRERLQPSLLDRLTDSERNIHEVTATTTETLLRERGLRRSDVVSAFQAIGLAPSEALETRRASVPTDDLVTLGFVSSVRMPSLPSLRKLKIATRDGAAAVELQAFCDVAVTTRPNQAAGGSAIPAQSMRKLREIVCRDLQWLLNASNLEPGVDLSRFPEVRRSVLNFGMPSLAGRAAATTDPDKVAEQIRATLASFEPRLSHVRVTPIASDPGANLALEFRIDAELWGQPVSQALSVRTRIELDSGQVLIDEARA